MHQHLRALLAPVVLTVVLTTVLVSALSRAGAADIDFTSPHASYVSGTGPRTVAIGRLDNDATNDVVVGNGSGNSIRVFLNTGGNGIFPTPAPALVVPGNPSSVAITDLDGDGKNDVVVASQVTPGKISVFLGLGDGSFQARQDYPATAILGAVVAMRVVDLNADGRLDVLAAGVGLTVFLGDGVGGLSTPAPLLTSGFVNSVTVGDLDNDGLRDIACTWNGQLTTLFCSSSGSPGVPVYAAPVAHPTGAQDLSVAMGDFNGDGLRDLAESHYYGPTHEIAVLLNQGGRVFGPPTTFASGREPKALMAEDMDGDGKLDLLCVNVGSQSFGILRGKGDGTFHPHIGYLTGAAPYVGSVGDLDGNGSVDVAVANMNASTVSVLLQGSGVAPAAVTNLTVDALPSDQYARLSWTTPLVDSYGPLTRYDLRLKVGGMAPGDFATATPVLPGPVVTFSGSAARFVVPGLTPGTTYGMAMTVTDAFGRTSVLSNIATLTTTASDVTRPGQPTLSSSVQGTSHCILRWLAPGDDGALGTATSYQLRMSTTDITDDLTFASATPILTTAPLPSGTQEHVVVGGLTAGVTYYFAMTATDDAGLTSTRSATLAVLVPTIDSSAPGRITDLAVIATTAHTITLRWTASGDDDLYGQASAFDVRWSDTSLTTGLFRALTDNVSGEPLPGVAGTVHEMVISGLPDQATYFLALTVADEVGHTTPISNVVSTTTSDGTAPAAIGDLVASGPTTSSLALTWTAPGDDGAVGTAASYDIRYSTAAITDATFAAATAVAGVAAPQVAGTVEHLTLSGLTAGATYYVAIRSSDEVPNVSALSTPASGTTSALGGGPGNGGGGSGGGGCGLGSGLAAWVLFCGLLLTAALRPRETT